LKSQLLCTFTSRNLLETVLSEIQYSYDLIFSHLFILQNKLNEEELFCTYNVHNDTNYRHPDLNTILVHRKRQTNTLYTINALNELVRMETGRVSRSHVVPWEEHRNSVLLLDSNGLRKVSTKVFEIINID